MPEIGRGGRLPAVRVYLGSDHAGFELKNHLVAHLEKQGHEVTDIGPQVYDAADDYPAFCVETALRVVADEGSRGIVVGGSGNGEQIAANKVPARGPASPGASRPPSCAGSTTTPS